MVHQTRTASKAIAAKHLSPMRSLESQQFGKYAVSSSPGDSFLHSSNSRLTVNAASTASGASAGGSSSNAALYKYNNMINNNREQFNALHFC